MRKSPTLTEMRALLFELRPPHTSPSTSGRVEERLVPDLARLRRDGLAATIHHHAADVARDGLCVEVDTRGYPSLQMTTAAHPPLAHEEAPYRIAQGALHNVRRQARARLETQFLKETGFFPKVTHL